MPAPRVRVGARDGEERAGVQFLECGVIVKTERPALTSREFLQGAPIAQRIQHVGRQRGEPARQVIARGDGDRYGRTTCRPQPRCRCGQVCARASLST